MNETEIARGGLHVARLARWRRLDTAALAGVGVGLSLYVLPLPFGGSLRAGFWLTLVSTLLHIYTSSTRPRSGSPDEAGHVDDKGPSL